MDYKSQLQQQIMMDQAKKRNENEMTDREMAINVNGIKYLKELN
jgi:hypothetical protein